MLLGIVMLPRAAMVHAVPLMCPLQKDFMPSVRVCLLSLRQQLWDRCSAIEQLAAVQVDQRKKVMYLDGCVHRVQHKFVIMVPLLKQLWRGACDRVVVVAQLLDNHI